VEPPVIPEIRNVLVPLVLLLLVDLHAFAAEPQAWLMTYGTAERVEEQFGHNAIWIRDPQQGVDQVYNFGFFDFDKPGFYREFLFGEMIYVALARSPEEELGYYRWRDREVRAQLLNLTPQQIRRLAGWLEERIQPETRDFRYDYYFNNCSNRVRDALDFALEGALAEFAQTRPGRLDFRDHTRRMLADDPLLYLGTLAGLGRPADRPRSLWEEMFLPEVVAEAVNAMEVRNERGEAVPLVMVDTRLYESTRAPDPRTPMPAWGLGFAIAAVGLALILLPARLWSKHPAAALIGARIWILLVTIAGALLGFLWLATDHQAAWRNENLLLLNPLVLLLIRFRGGRSEQGVALIVAAGLVLALVLKILPGAQWNHELLLGLIPVQLALLGLWWRHAMRDGATGPAKTAR
jgi:hypothetical protein